MLWIGLHLHRLPLEVFDRGLPAFSAMNQADREAVKPCLPRLAVCDSLHVLHACDAALACGVRTGMRRATALALAPDLQVFERDAARERDALDQVATWTLQFTPSTSLQPPDGLLLEVERSLKLFGGLPTLLQQLHGGLAQLGFSASRGVAPTATGAWLLARAASARLHLRSTSADSQADDRFGPSDSASFDAQLAGLPATLLEAAQPHAQALDGMGIRTVSELLALPRAGLARRFGAALLAEIDRARGLRPEPRAWHRAPAAFHARLELLAQVDSADALLFAARRLLAQLAGWLAAHQAATCGLALAAQHDDRPATTIMLQLADASRDLDRFTVLLRERLSTIQLPAAVHTLALACDAVVPLAPSSGQLFATTADARGSLARLIERLQARLGRERVQRLLPVADHRPEHAYRVELVDALPAETAADRRSRQTATGSGRRPALPSSHSGLPGRGGLPRPLWLLREPLPLIERDHRPYHYGPLRLRAGPERIEGGWWDMRLVQRDYFIAEGDDAALYWVFLARGTEDSPPTWYLHGRFG